VKRSAAAQKRSEVGSESPVSRRRRPVHAAHKHSCVALSRVQVYTMKACASMWSVEHCKTANRMTSKRITHPRRYVYQNGFCMSRASPPLVVSYLNLIEPFIAPFIDRSSPTYVIATTGKHSPAVRVAHKHSCVALPVCSPRAMYCRRQPLQCLL